MSDVEIISIDKPSNTIINKAGKLEFYSFNSTKLFIL